MSGPGSKKRRYLFIGTASVVAVWLLFTFREILAPFAVALLLAYALEPVVKRMERGFAFKANQEKEIKKIPRWLCVLLLYIGIVGTLALTVALSAPRLIQEIEMLSKDAPKLIASVQKGWIPVLEKKMGQYTSIFQGTAANSGNDNLSEEHPLELVMEPGANGTYKLILPQEGLPIQSDNKGGFVIGAIKNESKGFEMLSAVDADDTLAKSFEFIKKLVLGLVGGLFRFFIMLMISAYLLITSDKIFSFFRSLVARSARDTYDALLVKIDHGLSGVVRGQLIICLVNGVLSGIGFYALDLKYWPVLTVIATVLSIIPIFGAFLSSVPAVIVALQKGVTPALLVLLWIVLIHQIEANLLNPKIMGDSAKVHPVLVVFALLSGEHFFCFLGALLAVPVLSISQSVFLHFREIAYGANSGRMTMPPPPSTPTDATTPTAT